MNLTYYTLCIFTLVSYTFLPLNGMNPPKGILRKAYRSFERISATIQRPNDISVFMNDAKTVTLTPNVKNSITLSTTGLSGCVTTLLYAKDTKQYKHALLTHFEPRDEYHKEHVMELERQAKLLQTNMQQQYNMMKFIVIMPTCAYWDDKDKHDATYQKIYNELEFVIKNMYQLPEAHILSVLYALAPVGKGYTTAVHATLSNNCPSVCTIRNWLQGQTLKLE